MTIATQTLKHTYQTDGETRTWEVDFPVQNLQHVQIIVTDRNGVPARVTENYALNLAARTVTYPTVESGLDPLPAGEKITLIRVTPQTQQIDLTRQGEWDAQVLEDGLDKLTLIAQELTEQTQRTVRFSPAVEDPQTSADTFIAQMNQARQDCIQAASSAQSAQSASASCTQSQSAAAASAQSASSDAASAQTSCASAQQAAATASAVLADIQNRQTVELHFIAGTAESDYSGSLTDFDTGYPLAQVAVDVFVNGVRKHAQKPQEYTLSGQKVIFTSAVTSGDSITLLINGHLQTGFGPASTSDYGVIKLASSQEVATGTDASKAVTPATLGAQISATVTQLQTYADGKADTEKTRAQAAESTLTQALQTETTRATTAETNLGQMCLARQFTPLNVTVASGSDSIAGTYTLSDLPDDNRIRLALFECALQLSSGSGASSMALATDTATNPVVVCATNNGFQTSGTVLLPVKQTVTVSFPSTVGGVTTGTTLRLVGYL